MHYIPQDLAEKAGGPELALLFPLPLLPSPSSSLPPLSARGRGPRGGGVSWPTAAMRLRRRRSFAFSASAATFSDNISSAESAKVAFVLLPYLEHLSDLLVHGILRGLCLLAPWP